MFQEKCLSEHKVFAESKSKIAITKSIQYLCEKKTDMLFYFVLLHSTCVNAVGNIFSTFQLQKNKNLRKINLQNISKVLKR